jgi:formylglycine-generating enzyme required for sulfatase activity
MQIVKRASESVDTVYLEPIMVIIPAGSFWQGEPEAAKRVNTGRYAISKYPVTNAEFFKAVQAGVLTPRRIWGGNEPPVNRLDHPVANIGWEDALTYLNWLSKVSGKAYRLPTGTEWERAARGDSDRRHWPWSDTFDIACANTRDSGRMQTTPITAHPQGVSPWGVYDLIGNVWEWTSDFYDPINPPLIPENIRVPDNFLRTLRGGGAYAWAQTCSARVCWWPHYMFSGHLGIRLCLDC